MTPQDESDVLWWRRFSPSKPKWQMCVAPAQLPHRPDLSFKEWPRLQYPQALDEHFKNKQLTSKDLHELMVRLAIGGALIFMHASLYISYATLHIKQTGATSPPMARCDSTRASRSQTGPSNLLRRQPMSATASR